MKLKLILTQLLFAHSIILYGQSKTITGRVIDEDGNPVAYASIVENPRTRNGTVSDKDGFYKLEKVTSYVLKCTHINFEEKTDTILNNTKIVFILHRHIFQNRNAIVMGQAEWRKINNPVGVEKKDSVLKKERREDDEEKIFTRVEIPAMFTKYNYDLYQYFSRHINIDTLTIVNDFEGTVVVRFTIDINGKAKNAIILRGVNDFTDSAVIDVINKMPLWIPAIQNGRYVDSEQQIAIYFNIWRVHKVY